MPRLAAVFDSNVYRSAGSARFAKLRAGESQHSVIGYASYPTATELIARAADPDESEARAASAAIQRLVDHCTAYDGASYVLRFVHGPVQQIARMLFGRIDDAADTANAHGRLLGEWAANPAARKQLRPQVEWFARKAEELRRQFVQELWGSVVTQLTPDAKAWRDVTRPSPEREAVLDAILAGDGKRLLAKSMIAQAAASVGVVVARERADEYADWVGREFALIVEHRNLLAEALIQHGPDMSKGANRNSIFDTHICGATAASAVIGNFPVVLVSDDGTILAAADRASMRQRVLRLAEYEALLACDAMQFHDAIDRIAEAK